ncbi:MAG: hypothetical protein E6R03_13770 [Hyphomicrobiaceae bacterium]|nr:MAG: hypothetical protein E6R03_13770 [Hyphomicrobiaceae bacterium]
MSKRPAAIGADVSVKTLADADAVLHELAWLANEKARIAAEAKQKIDRIKADAAEKAFVDIDGTAVAFDKRVELLESKLSKWVESQIERHLDGKKRTVELPHGKVGLRQQPLVAMIGDESTEATVLDAIDERCGVVTAIKAQLERKSQIGKARCGDLISVEIKPALKAMKDALEAMRLSREDVESLGVSIRDAYDEPVLTPTKMIVADAA